MNKIFFILIITVLKGHGTVEGMYSNREALWKVASIDSIPKTSELTYKRLPRKIKRKIRKYNHKFDRFLQRSIEEVKFRFLEARENNKYIFVLFRHNNGRASHFDLFVFNKTSSPKFSYQVYELEGDSMMKETILERYYKNKLKTSICTF